MNVNLLSDMGINISVHNPVQVKLNMEVDHPSSLAVLMGDSSFDYRWITHEDGSMTDMLEVNIFGRIYEINEKFITFVNRKE